MDETAAQAALSGQNDPVTSGQNYPVTSGQNEMIDIPESKDDNNAYMIMSPTQNQTSVDKKNFSSNELLRMAHKPLTGKINWLID